MALKSYKMQKYAKKKKEIKNNKICKYMQKKNLRSRFLPSQTIFLTDCNFVNLSKKKKKMYIYIY